jgi:hypothetical protein
MRTDARTQDAMLDVLKKAANLLDDRLTDIEVPDSDTRLWGPFWRAVPTAGGGGSMIEWADLEYLLGEIEAVIWRAEEGGS